MNFTNAYAERVWPSQLANGSRYRGPMPINEDTGTLLLALEAFCVAWIDTDTPLDFEGCEKSLSEAKFSFEEGYYNGEDGTGEIVGQTHGRNEIYVMTRFKDQENRVYWSDTAIFHELAHYMKHYGEGTDVCVWHDERCWAGMNDMIANIKIAWRESLILE